MRRLAVLRPGSDEPFPPLDEAWRRPNGLLAAGGDLSATRLLDAYRHGIFPWFSPGEPILWWSPDPRLVFETGDMHVPRRLRRELRKSSFTLRTDIAFAQVMRECAAPREDQAGTWIGPDMLEAYVDLHKKGHAHSIEVYQDGNLVGGLYGVAIGRMFFGESMFSRVDNASKVALLSLARMLQTWGWPLIDAQVASSHLYTLGGKELPRREFAARIAALTGLPGRVGSWIGAADTLRINDF